MDWKKNPRKISEFPVPCSMVLRKKKKKEGIAATTTISKQNMSKREATRSDLLTDSKREQGFLSEAQTVRHIPREAVESPNNNSASHRAVPAAGFDLILHGFNFVV